MPLTRLTTFAVIFASAFGLLFALVSFLVSSVVGPLSWRDVFSVAVVGFCIGSTIVLRKLPTLIRDELQSVYVALMQEWIEAVMKQCAEQGVELDIAPLHGDVLQAAQTQLQGVTFHTIDVAEELRA
jgi:hypothetical protein